MLRALHHGVVDGDIRHPGEACAIQFEMTLLLALKYLTVLQAVTHRIQHLGRMGLEFSQHTVGAHAEHAAVPQMHATVQVALGRQGVRLFYKLRHFKAVSVKCRAFFDVAKTGFGPGWQDAEGHQPTLFGQLPGAVDGLSEGGNIGDQVVGGQHQQLRIAAVALRHLQGSCGNRRGGVAAKRFEDKAQFGGGSVQCTVIIQRAKKHLPVGHGQQLRHIRQVRGAGKGLLQQALAVGQAHEGLGHGLARHGPQPGTRATGDDAGDQCAHGKRL